VGLTILTKVLRRVGTEFRSDPSSKMKSALEFPVKKPFHKVHFSSFDNWRCLILKRHKLKTAENIIEDVLVREEDRTQKAGK
jgi:hypothetical protein